MAKNKVSNNLLTILLAFAILTSVVGILASMNILSPLTGSATSDTGTVTINITQSVSCTAGGDDTIIFGNLASGDTNTSERLNDTATDFSGDFHSIENNGNSNLTIQAYASEDLWENYLAPTAHWQVHCNTSQSGTCNVTYGSLAENGQYTTIIQGLEAGDSTDLGRIGYTITAQADEPSGQKSGTVTYYCTSV